MKSSAVITIVLLALIAGRAQERSVASVEILDEPHHKLLLENSAVRVFRLSLQPGEATASHRHKYLYAYVSLRSATIASEVRGRTPVVTNLEGNEVHTSKGGFTLVERNKGSERADLLVIESLKSSSGGFVTPIGGYRFHDAALGEIFQLPGMRAYMMSIAVGGRMEKHKEDYDRLVVALSDLKLREDIDGQQSTELEMKAGDVGWFPRGVTHATTNLGVSPAIFITFQFE
jgi:quercetin dioxygenase-like cupin family protein